MMSERRQVKFIGKIEVKRDVKSGLITFEQPDLGVGHKETRVFPDVWNACKEPFLTSNGAIWGIVTLSYGTETAGRRTAGVTLEVLRTSGRTKPISPTIKRRARISKRQNG